MHVAGQEPTADELRQQAMIETASMWQQLSVAQQRAVEALTTAVEGMGAILAGATLDGPENGSQGPLSVEQTFEGERDGDIVSTVAARSPFIGGGE